MSTTSIETREGRLVARDGLRLAWRWNRVADSAATLVVHHGFAEHMGRYGNLVEAMSAAGIDTFLYDARGHGASGGRRGHVDAFADYAADLRQVIDHVRAEAGRVPYLLGHSQGGLVVSYALRERALPVAGIVLSNPALAASVEVPGWKVVAAKTLSRLLPTVALPVGIPASHISRDPASVRDYESDPAIFGAGTTRWGAEFLAAQQHVLAAPLRVDVPLLALIGTGDQVVDPEVGQRYFASVAADDRTIEVFEGFYHELFNEPAGERDRPLAALRDWLTARLAVA
ncbi:MAG: hypothetical protein RIT45_3914 [Pseudomonadota bacterium]|jgi:alpha-beta hydrolase superfamily lysophospholipase